MTNQLPVSSKSYRRSRDEDRVGPVCFLGIELERRSLSLNIDSSVAARLHQPFSQARREESKYGAIPSSLLQGLTRFLRRSSERVRGSSLGHPCFPATVAICTSRQI